MTAFNQKIQTLLDKGQGPAARALDRLPRLAQESLAKILGYSYQYPDSRFIYEMHDGCAN